MSQLASVRNALRVLHLLRRTGPLRLSEIAAELGIGRSTAHRLITTLRAEYFIAQEPRGKRYELGPAMLFSAGVSAIEHCVSTANPIMVQLRDAIGETVHLSTIRGTDVIFLASAESTRQVRVTTRVGRHPKAHATAVGKLLLAALPPGRFEELYPDEQLEQLTLRTASSRSALQREMRAAAEHGYARNIRESEDDMYTIAVPLRRPDGGVACALAISAPYSRVNARADGPLTRDEQDYLSSLRSAQAAIESRLAF